MFLRLDGKYLYGGGIRITVFPAIRARTQLGNAADKIIHHPGKSFTLGGRNPFQTQAVVVQAELLQHQLQERDPPPGPVIAAQIMAVAGMTTGHHDTIGALAKGAQDEFRINSGRTHAPDDAEMRLDFHARNAGQISPGIRTPVTAKYDYFRFKIHFNSKYFNRRDAEIAEVKKSFLFLKDFP